MFFLRAFASATKNFFKDLNKAKEKSNEIVPEKPFPRFRGSVDEGIGLVIDGVYDYYCNICLQTILGPRHHFVNVKIMIYVKDVSTILKCYKYKLNILT